MDLKIFADEYNFQVRIHLRREENGVRIVATKIRDCERSIETEVSRVKEWKMVSYIILNDKS